jgi:DUF4097 and DUF4098 domain-containing protein YvlB
MKRQFRGAGFAAAPFLIGTAAHAQWSSPYTASDITIENVGADVGVSDGSGDINVRNVTGSFTVESDGSGSIYATDVHGSVVVQHDGSGSIEVNKVGKDFTVESKGGGSIENSHVSGRVDIPERHRDRRRGSDER